MNRMKAIIFFSSFVLIAGSIFFYFNYGIPWDLYKYNKSFKNYLEEKYQGDFVVEDISYDFFHDTYHARAYEQDQPDIRFYVGQDMRSKDIDDGYGYEMLRAEANEDITAMVQEHLPDYEEVNVEVVSMETKELEINIWINNDPSADLKNALANEIESSEYTTDQLFFNSNSY